MEELLEKETQKNKTQKKEAPRALKFFVIGGFICLAIALIFTSTYTSKPLTAAEIAQINAEKKSEFLKLESQVYTTTKQCDADYSKAIKSITNSGYGDSATNFQNAHYDCLDAFNQVQKIQIPDNLNDTQTKMLKAAIEDLTSAYACKNGASQSAYKYITTGDISKMDKAKDEINLSQEGLLNAMFKIEQVKKELNISAK